MAANTAAILAKLGIDSSKVPAELAEADKFFKQFAREAEKTAGSKAGGDSGSKFMKAFQNRFSGAGLFGTLSTALGLNLNSLAEKLAEAFQKAFGGGSKKAFEEADKLADAVAEKQKEAIESRLSTAQKIAKAEAEIAKAIAKQQEIGKSGATLTAEQLKEQAAAQLAQLENEKKLADLRKADGELSKKFSEELARYDREKLTKEQQVVAIRKEVNKLAIEAAKTGQTQGERDAKQLEILERQKAIDELSKEIADDKAKTEEKITKEKERQADLTDKIATGERKIRDAKADLGEKQAALGDRSRLTVSELAALPGEQRQAAVDAAREDQRRAEAFRFGSSLDDAGLSDEQKRLRAQARQVLDLEAEGEKARVSGNQSGAEEIFGRVGQLREALVATGAVKSTEGDRQKELVAQVKRQTEILEDLKKQVADARNAKLKNQ